MEQLMNECSDKKHKLAKYDLNLLKQLKVHERARRESKILIVFKDFEFFEPSMIESIIGTFGAFSFDFPLLLVFGIATSTECIHNTLSISTITRLCCEKFHVQESATIFDRLIHEVIYSFYLYK
jgi:origin recognition complex subunit 3